MKIEDAATELVRRMEGAGIQDPWRFVSDEAKERLAFLRFMGEVLNPSHGDGE